ncbi:MAG TPA: winged helix-turn-helix domain-containing protein, partial [Isosphaeraceae bacterium]|nr:winged helix-turn-helix domain-containing protein [Isosphaeraceae bacterium]
MFKFYMDKIHQHYTFFNPILRALRLLGGSGSIKEIDGKVIELLNFANESLDKLHNPETGNETEIEYRLAWARSYLKKYGLIENSSRGIWPLTRKAESVQEINPEEIVKLVRKTDKVRRESRKEGKGDSETQDEGTAGPESWRVQLYRLLTKELEPAAFERFVQRLL